MKNKIAPKKSLSQNFLISQAYLHKIASLCIEQGIEMIEIGPGKGALTKAVLELNSEDKLLAIEIDDRMISELDKLSIKFPNFEYRIEDFLKASVEVSDKIVFGNLPYSVASKIILSLLSVGSKAQIDEDTLKKTIKDSHFPDDIASNSDKTKNPQNLGKNDDLMEDHNKIKGDLDQSEAKYSHSFSNNDKKAKKMVFLLQKEVADRITASPGKSDYGSLSILVQAYYEVKKGPKIPPSCFFPKPKVNSQVVIMTKKERTEEFDHQALMTLLSAAFKFKRKKLRNGLYKEFPDCAKYLDIEKRPEEIEVLKYLEICKAIKVL